MSRVSRQIDAYRAGTISLPALVSSLASAPALDEITTAYQTGLLSPSDYAAILAARQPTAASHPVALPASPPPLKLVPSRPRRHGVVFFILLALLLVPLAPFVIALDIVIVNALRLSVFGDFIFMLLSFPATYYLEYLFFTSLLPRLGARRS